MNSDLKGEGALISGASSGFGADAASVFSTTGAKLLAGTRRVGRLNEVC